MAEITYEGNYDMIVTKLKEMEQRLSLLEILVNSEVANTRKTCKACDVRLDSTNANDKARIAELCDSCWEMLDMMHDDVGF